MSTFNRLENKYVINQQQYEMIKSAFQNHMIPDQFTDGHSYLVSNIYYDTEDNMLIKKSVSKPVFKEKLRLRGYGKLNQDSMVFLEIKMKIEGSTGKRRTQLSIDDAEMLIKYQQLPDLKPYHHLQVLKEILYLIKKYPLKPALFLSYEREAFYENNNSDLRITFDHDIITRRYDFDITKRDEGTPMIDNTHYIMEIKTNHNLPMWLTEVLCTSKAFSSSYSKYGYEFFDYLQQTNTLNGGQIKCGLNPYSKVLK